MSRPETVVQRSLDWAKYAVALMAKHTEADPVALANLIPWFAAAIRRASEEEIAAEREACAKVIENLYQDASPGASFLIEDVREDGAQRIRARVTS